jgi:riboflavin biosynthesis pyrimidine reductase
VVIFTASRDDPPDVPAHCLCLRGAAGADGSTLELAPLLRELRADHGVRSILCEGGPALNDGLLREGLVDELWLALAPKLAAGEALTVVTGAALRPVVELELVSVLESESHLFMRYRITPPPA